MFSSSCSHVCCAGFTSVSKTPFGPLAAQTLQSFATRGFHASAVGGDGLLLRPRSLLPMPATLGVGYLLATAEVEFLQVSQSVEMYRPCVASELIPK